MARTGRPQDRLLSLSAIEREELERSVDRVRPSRPGSSSSDHSGVGFRRDQSQHSPTTGVSNPTVCHWRKKWFDQGLVGLYGEARPDAQEPTTKSE